MVLVWVDYSFPQNDTGPGFLPTWLPRQKKNVYHPKALKGERWPEFVSVLLYFPPLWSGLPSPPFDPCNSDRRNFQQVPRDGDGDGGGGGRKEWE